MSASQLCPIDMYVRLPALCSGEIDRSQSNQTPHGDSFALLTVFALASFFTRTFPSVNTDLPIFALGPQRGGR